MRRRGSMIIWPQYFDKNRPVRLGRRISLMVATPDPTIQDLANAARKLGYSVEVDPNPRFPPTWFDETTGNILIDAMGQKKLFILHRLAPEIQASQLKRVNEAKQEIMNKKDKKKKNIESIKKKIIEKTS
jgi:signal recognition particle subunit SRP19